MTGPRLRALLCLAPVAVRLHEGAHVAAARMLGWRTRTVYPDPITLNEWGSRTEYDADDATWPEHAIVALAGPAASLAWLVAVLVVAAALPSPWGVVALPSAWFAAVAVCGGSADLAVARDAIGYALADALGEEVDAGAAGVARAALRLVRRRLA